jgi:hypothetical protein
MNKYWISHVCLSVCLLVCEFHLGNCWNDFVEIWYWILQGNSLPQVNFDSYETVNPTMHEVQVELYIL